jgi:hypothetical protein
VTGSAGAAGSPAGNSISGNPDGAHPWTSIAQATWVGSPDSASTIVIYLLSKPYPCDANGWKPGGGWDSKVPADSIVMELKANPVPTTFPTMYTVPNTNPALAAPPPKGQAFAIWSSVNGHPVAPETSAASGTLTLTSLKANTNVTGTFDLKLAGANTLSGSFDAKYCAGAGEP